jgi:hypothetical protein
MMTEEQFWKWYDDYFIKQYGGFMPHEGWFKDVENAHLKLREFIGGPQRLEEISLENAQNPLDTESRAKFQAEIIKLLPQYFTSYNFKEDLLKFPTIQNGDFKGMKVAKHIQFYANKILDATKKGVLSKLLSDLGQAWNKARTQKQQVQVLMSTTQQAFIMLGHYYSDSIRGSCFKQLGCHQKDKYLLGQHPNSYVMLVGTDLSDLSPNNTKIYSRMWGIADQELKTFSLSNIYISEAKWEDCTGNVYMALDSFFDRILPGESKLRKTNGKLKVDGIFKNPEDLSYSRADISTSTFIIRAFNGLEKQGKCPSCGYFFRRSEIIDGKIYCEKCAKAFGVCAISGKKSVNLVTVRNEEGVTIKVLSEIAAADFKYCEVTRQYWPKKSVVSTRHYGNVNIKEATKMGLTQCDGCKHYTSTRSDDTCQDCGFQKTKDKTSVRNSKRDKTTATVNVTDSYGFKTQSRTAPWTYTYGKPIRYSNDW